MHHSNGNRASLLSGLRTGGVRGPAVPHTAGPGASFQIPHNRFGSANIPLYEDELDLDFGQTMTYSAPAPYGVPMTAGLVDNRASHFNNIQSMSHQQMLLRQAQLASLGGMGAMSPVNPMDAQLQLQMMQAMGAYGYNPVQAAQVAAHQHALNAQKQAMSAGLHRVPASAGPTQTSFEPRSASFVPRGRLGSVDDVPMTAALGGKFGARVPSSGFNSAPVYNPSPMVSDAVPGTPGSSTVVISGGVSLGGASPVPQAPSRADGVTSWRRPSMAGTAPIIGRTPSPPKRASPPSASPPRLTVSTPEETDEFLAQINARPIDPRQRPAPLSLAAAQGSVPTTESAGIYTANRASPPKTTSALGELTRQMDGMNIGRARSGSVAQTAPLRLSQPIRQPIGPTSIKSEEFAAKNFASRMGARPHSAPIEIAAF